MLLKSYLAAVVLTFGLASGAHAAAVTINGPHASLDCTTCHANGQFKAPAKETCFPSPSTPAKPSTGFPTTVLPLIILKTTPATRIAAPIVRIPSRGATTSNAS